MQRFVIATLFSMALFMTAPAFAQSVHAIVFNDSKASTNEVDVKVGDVVSFYHMDPEEAHQLYSTDKDHQFDVKHIFQNGDHFDIQITSPGSFDILCHAMPHMKITVNATE